ncbi:MAG TPA: N-acetylglutaminylglutamine synthetase, partial [Gammaproteobacteria bacterium]
MRFTDQPPSYQHLEAIQNKGESRSRLRENACIDCGWGRVLMGHTFKRPQDIADQLLQESPGKRDIAMYVADPHVVLAAAPQTLFLDPSDSYRLDLEQPLADAAKAPGITVCQVSSIEQARGVNELYLKRDMVPTDAEYIWAQRASDQIVWLVAIDKATDAVVGTVMG